MSEVGLYAVSPQKVAKMATKSLPMLAHEHSVACCTSQGHIVLLPHDTLFLWAVHF